MKKILFLAVMAAVVTAQAQQEKTRMPAQAEFTPAKRIGVHGHRGSRGTHPENTLPAFEEALRAGADVLELDMGVTKDNVVVVSHDPNINPVICLGADGKKLEKPVAIRTLTSEELKAYDCGSLKNPRFPEQTPVPGTRVPTLAEVFELVKNSKHPGAAAVEFNMETKIFPAEPALAPAPAEFAAAVLNVVKKYGMENRVIIQSFDGRTLKEIKKLAPAVRTAQLTSEELLDLVPSLKASGTDIWSPYFRWITPESVKAAQAADIPVIPWTLNEPKEWEAAVAGGVDAIITDYPAKLIAFLKEKKLR